MKRFLMTVCCMVAIGAQAIFATPCGVNSSSESSSYAGNNLSPDINAQNIVGEWVAQIDIPQNKLTILMEMNFLDSENCIIKCSWLRAAGSTKEESGKAKYRLEEDKLVITFLNEEEHIRTDNVFRMENVYNITLSKDRLVILKNRQFRNVDVTFGRGYENRGFATILFN